MLRTIPSRPAATEHRPIASWARATYGPTLADLRDDPFARPWPVNLLRIAPLSIIVALLSLLVTAGSEASAPRLRDATFAVADYQARQLFQGQLWRLPLSGLLPHGWWQYGITLALVVIVFIPAEHAFGTARFGLYLGLGHVVPTLAVAVFARATENADILSRHDYGTSCVFVAAATALACWTRSRFVWGMVIINLAADPLYNLTTTVIEHLTATAVTIALVALTINRHRPTSPTVDAARYPGPAIERIDAAGSDDRMSAPS